MAMAAMVEAGIWERPGGVRAYLLAHAGTIWHFLGSTPCTQVSQCLYYIEDIKGDSDGFWTWWICMTCSFSETFIVHRWRGAADGRSRYVPGLIGVFFGGMSWAQERSWKIPWNSLMIGSCCPRRDTSRAPVGLCLQSWSFLQCIPFGPCRRSRGRQDALAACGRRMRAWMLAFERRAVE